MTSLIRPEVVEANRRKLYGEVTLWQPISLTWYVILALFCALTVLAYLFFGQQSVTEQFSGNLHFVGGVSVLLKPGDRLARLEVAPGSRVTAGQPVGTVSSGRIDRYEDMAEAHSSAVVSHAIISPVSGLVTGVDLSSATRAGPILSIAPHSAPVQARLHVPVDQAFKLKVGQKAILRPSLGDGTGTGGLVGKIDTIEYVGGDRQEYTVVIDVRTKASAGLIAGLTEGMPVVVDVAISKRRLIAMILPVWKSGQ